RALRGAPADTRRLELSEAASGLAVVADLPITVLGCHGRGHDAAVRLTKRRPDARGRGDDRGRLGVAVGRLPKLLHAWIGLTSGLFDRERDRRALTQRAIHDSSLIDVEIF